MPGEDLGNPHVTIGGLPPADQRIDHVWVLVAITDEGGEGIYSQTIGRLLFNFVITDPAEKDRLEDNLRERGSVELARREDMKLVWRRLGSVEEEVEIT